MTRKIIIKNLDKTYITKVLIYIYIYGNMKKKTRYSKDVFIYE